MLTLDALARELGCSLTDLFDLGVIDAEEARAAISDAHPVGELLVPTPLAEKFRAAWLRTQSADAGKE